jgi:uncharacterized repeat protein (TIGR03803 family)
MHEPAYATQSIESQPLSLLTGGLPKQSQETVLHSFAGGSDGANPDAGLINVNGVLYGTASGGAESKGTVFKITTAGAETVLHTFGGAGDGAFLRSGLTALNGVLYGTTIGGGTNGLGTVFKITTSGAESVLYSFAGGSDGATPFSGLTAVNGVLYGTTDIGGVDGCSGSEGCGTVFKITTSGAESVLYRFGSTNDGQNPGTDLTDVNGVLYGTTSHGGASQCSLPSCGTVYKITTAGAESVLYDFAGGSDGAGPSSLVNVNGVLYGTTGSGGGDRCSGGNGCGTVFKITTSGAETVLHRFAGQSDGGEPPAGLTNVNGILYGTTEIGGANGLDHGTAFKITTSGVKTILYTFTGTDGSQPEGNLTNVNGLLYGTTALGGAHHLGTVFSLSL